MGRHGDPGAVRKRGLTLLFAVVLIVAVALGAWWWSLRSATDPIDANPIDAVGVVISSARCTGPGPFGTVVEIVGQDPVVRTTVDGCGHRVGQRVAVQFLAGEPGRARLAGVATAPATGGWRDVLPFLILAAGVCVVLGTALTLRARSRRGTTTGTDRVSVAALLAAADDGPQQSSTPGESVQ